MNPQAIEARDSLQRTPLHLAARNGHVATATWLAETWPQALNCDDTRGWTPLRLATKGRHHQHHETAMTLQRIEDEIRNAQEDRLTTALAALRHVVLPALRALVKQRLDAMRTRYPDMHIMEAFEDHPYRRFVWLGGDEARDAERARSMVKDYLDYGDTMWDAHMIQRVLLHLAYLPPELFPERRASPKLPESSENTPLHELCTHADAESVDDSDMLKMARVRNAYGLLPEHIALALGKVELARAVRVLPAGEDWLLDSLRENPGIVPLAVVERLGKLQKGPVACFPFLQGPNHRGNYYLPSSHIREVVVRADNAYDAQDICFRYAWGPNGHWEAVIGADRDRCWRAVAWSTHANRILEHLTTPPPAPVQCLQNQAERDAVISIAEIRLRLLDLSGPYTQEVHERYMRGFHSALQILEKDLDCQYSDELLRLSRCMLK